MAIKVDWNSVEDSQDYSPIPEGKYLAIVENVEEKETKNGDPMWSVRFSIDGDKYNGRKVFTNLVFNEKGLSNVKKLYSAIFGTKLPKSCDKSDIEGEKVYIEVEITEYNGKKQNSIPFAGFEAFEGNEEEVPF